jgi:surfeit locus 1 family protein
VSAKASWTAGRWLMLLLAVSVMLLTASLGAWQLRRAAYKTTLSEAIEKQKSQGAAVSIKEFAIKDIANKIILETIVHRPVAFKGKWLHDYTVFLDNRPMQIQGSQRVGFYVATPFQLQDTGELLWVQRGWVARDFQDRSKLPALPQDAGVVLLKGRMLEKISQAYAMNAPATPATPDASDAGKSAPGTKVTPGTPPTTLAPTSPLRIWQNLPSWQLPQAVLPVAVLQTESDVAQDPMVRSWPAADSGVAKHYGYAFQWFALSALVLILYVWFQLIAPRRKTHAAQPQD